MLFSVSEPLRVSGRGLNNLVGRFNADVTRTSWSPRTNKKGSIFSLKSSVT